MIYSFLWIYVSRFSYKRDLRGYNSESEHFSNEHSSINQNGHVVTATTRHPFVQHEYVLFYFEVCSVTAIFKNYAYVSLMNALHRVQTYICRPLQRHRIFECYKRIALE